jgi:RNA-directed DNA polymerase
MNFKRTTDIQVVQNTNHITLDDLKAIEIPKKNGGTRILGVPTVLDRIAQMVAKIYFEPQVEPYFHSDSYGYRPSKSAADALAATRKRCWKYNWLLEFDIKGLFDNIDHDLLMKAVCMHTNNPWAILYIQRWLKTPFQMPDGTVKERTKGTPQGGVVRRAKLYHGLRYNPPFYPFRMSLV